MNKPRYRHVVITAICLLLTPQVFGQGAGDGIPDKAHALDFFHRVQAALKTNRPNQVAPLMHYPLRAFVNGKSISIRSEAEFIHDYDLVFTQPRVKAILACKDDDVWHRDQGYSIPYGVIWFDDFVPSNVRSQTGKYKIKTVNSAMEEDK